MIHILAKRLYTISPMILLTNELYKRRNKKMTDDIMADIWNAPSWALNETSNFIHDLSGFRCQFDEGIPFTSRRSAVQRATRRVPGQMVNVPQRLAPCPTAPQARTPMMGGFAANIIARG